MSSITQDLIIKQAVMKYSEKNGVTEAAKRYKKTRQWIYYWLRRYDGSVDSFAGNESKTSFPSDPDNSSYFAALFVQEAVKFFKFKMECIQTDNGQEFTKEYSSYIKAGKPYQPTLFQKVLQKMGIRHKQIRPYTPGHNGKAERSHRKDQERFYDRHTFYSLEDFKKQLQEYNEEDM